jgi:hypothetical protein
MNLRTFSKGALVLWLVALLFPACAFAQTKRALLIGINTYLPAGQPRPSVMSERRLGNLDGSVNDVEAMSEVLTRRFGFDRVVVLKDQQAKRQMILDAIQNELITPAAPGDVSVFYYAGHGSQVKNSASDEPDRYDESIVPADAYTGVPDIRDKELRRYFNSAVDKGVILTAIFDSCNSGSIARGADATRRSANPDDRDIRDGSTYGPKPESRGALILSAAQDTQSAYEMKIDGIPLGVFTNALLRTLNSANAPGESAQRIFSRTRALMQSDGIRQEPVLAGVPDRLGKTLFGLDPAKMSGILAIPAGRVNRDQVELHGGSALGFAKGTILQKIGGTRETPVRVMVEEVLGLNRSSARVSDGLIANVKPGDVFEIVNWVRPESAILKVWIPTSPLNRADLQRFAASLTDLQRSDSVEWVEDPAKAQPSHFISWEMQRWILYRPGGLTTDLGATFNTATVLNSISAEQPKAKPRLFIHFPMSSDAGTLQLGRGTPNDAVEVVSSPSNANYYLVGRYTKDDLEYSWTLRRVFEGNGEGPSGTVVSGLSALPLSTEWLTAAGTRSFGASLTDAALQLGRIRSWLQLEGPASAEQFPYRLALRHVGTGKTIMGGGEIEENQSYGLVLQSDSTSGRIIPRRYVYVFAINSAGKGGLLYPPPSTGNVENRFPLDNGSPTQATPKEIVLGEDLFDIGTPLGIETYIMLASDEAIPDTSVFDFEGVNRDSAARGPETELGRLLRGIGATTRSPISKTPVNWSIDRATVLSVPARK